MVLNKLLKNYVSHWSDILKHGAILMEFKSGQEIFYENHVPYGVFIVLEGKLELIKHNNDEEHIKSYAPLNVPIGLDLLIHESSYPFTGIARSPLKVLFISKNNLSLPLWS